MRSQLEQDLLKLQEEELELDDERACVLSYLPEPTLIPPQYKEWKSVRHSNLLDTPKPLVHSGPRDEGKVQHSCPPNMTICRME